jgi:hypothetical protein
MNEFKLKKIFNWQEAGKPIVKKYVADLYQTGTNAPVPTELINNTGVAFTYEYLAVGVYAVYSNKPLFTNITGQKVQVALSNNSYEDLSGIAFPVWEDVIIILTNNALIPTNGLLGNNAQNALEITIYP